MHGKYLSLNRIKHFGGIDNPDSGGAAVLQTELEQSTADIVIVLSSPLENDWEEETSE